jgi:hypothetical protein
MEKKFGTEFGHNLTPDPARFDQTKGREIAGFEPKNEHFGVLKESDDYQIVEENNLIKSVKPLHDFFLFVNHSRGTTDRTVYPPHWRTITTEDIDTSFEYSDKDASIKNIHYYCVNTKGTGFLKPTAEGILLDDYATWARTKERSNIDFDNEILGMCTKNDCLGKKGEIINESKHLTKEGLRCEMMWAIAKLKKIFYQGRETTIEELRNKNVIPKRLDWQPYMAVRLLRTNHRIEQCVKADHKQDLFENAFKIFNRETLDDNLPFPILEIGNAQHEKIFFQEFFSRMGANMAVLLNLGYSHSHMHSSNVTMAAEIVDIGTISKNDPDFYQGIRRQHIKDMRDISYSLKMLLNGASSCKLSFGNVRDLQKTFFSSFDSVSDRDRQRENKTDYSIAREWMGKIFEKVIVRGGHLPSLRNNAIEDWVF